MKKILMIALCAVCIVIGATASSCDEKGLGDAPVNGRRGDDRPAVVINFPDTFMNVAIKCFNGTAIFSHTREAAPLVVPNSDFCDGDEVVDLPDKNGNVDAANEIERGDGGG